MWIVILSVVLSALVSARISGKAMSKTLAEVDKCFSQSVDGIEQIRDSALQAIDRHDKSLCQEERV